MQIVLIAVGSAGDVFPFLGIGDELRRRGHSVVIYTNPHFQSLVQRLGLQFVPLGTERDYLDAIANPDIWHPTRGFETISRLIDFQVPMYQQILQLREAGAELFVGHTLALAARIAQEKVGLPLVTVHASPALFRSEHEVPTMMGTVNFSRWPRWFKRLGWWAADRWMVDPLVGPTINPLRVSLGLPPAKRVFAWMHSPLRTIGLFPAWYAAPQPDWPGQVRLAGFPLFDVAGGTEPPQEVEDFLAAGPPPIVFTPGSAMMHGQAFFAAAADACQRLGRRGMLLTRFAQQVPAGLPQGVKHFAYAPLSRILPRCAALVHHGGIGTTAAGLAGGVPQVIMPMSHDQPDNAARVVRLGVGTRILPRQFTAGTLGRQLRERLESPAVRQRCRQGAEQCGQDRGLRHACDLIESALPTAPGGG